MLTDVDLWIIVMLLSAVWHPFTAEDPSLSECCNAAFLQICFDEETNASTTRLGQPEGKYIFSYMLVFGRTIALLQSTFWDL